MSFFKSSPQRRFVHAVKSTPPPAKSQWDPARIAASMALDSDIAIPTVPGTEYRPYQKAGIAYAMDIPVCLIADSMRLGKTIQAIGVANVMGAKRILIVPPAIAKINWERHLRRWLIGGDTCSIGIARGAKITGLGRGKSRVTEPDILICNYDSLHQHLDFIHSVAWDLVVFDESKALMTDTSRRTKAAFGGRVKLRTPDPVTGRRTKDCPRIEGKKVLLLDGTPIFTRPINLFTTCNRAGLFTEKFHFGLRYCGGHKTRFGWDFTGANNLEELQSALRATFMVRRERSQVVEDIPPIRETIVLPEDGLSDLIEAERSVIQNNLAEFEALLAGDVGDAEADRIVNEFHTLDGIEREEVASDEIMNVAGQLSTIRRELALRKCDMVIEHVQSLLDAGEKKIILFAHHRDVVTKLHEALPGSVKVMGGMSDTARQCSIDTFVSDPTCRVFVGNLTSAGQAIDLSVADVVVFAEMSWVPAEMDQAEERAWNVTKQTAVTIQRLVVENSLDERMCRVLERRQKNIARALNSKHLRV